MAKRKGRSYGTILCDLERRKVVDLLPEATAQVFAAWLRAHPGVEIISRDRAGTFAEGAKVGAPDAIQVADRWHLLRNLGDAVVSFLDRHRQRLPRTSLVDSSGSPKDLRVMDQGGEKVPTTTRLSAHEHERQQRRARRLERYLAVVKLAEKGVSVRAIARSLGLSRKTVQKYLNAGSFPEMPPRSKRASILDPFRPYLLQRMHDGCRNAGQLFRELKDPGYTGDVPSSLTRSPICGVNWTEKGRVFAWSRGRERQSLDGVFLHARR